jgi:CxxC motif-containing protein (DUF1111 family)
MSFPVKPLKFAICLVVSCVIGHSTCLSQDFSQIGGALTSDLPGRFALQLPAPSITNEPRRQQQLAGFSDFHSDATKRTGLGPFFVNSSCGACHIDNGKGPARFSRDGIEGSTMVVKVGIRGRNPDGSTKEYPGVGGQLQDQTINGSSRHSIRLRWQIINGKYPDGTKYELRKPILSFTLNGKSHRTALRSLRMTPGIIGPGLLEAIPDSVIVERADLRDTNKDGISGRPNFVLDRNTSTKKIGRFGFKATHPTDEQQSAAALFGDMGVTSSLFRIGTKEPEMAEQNLLQLVVYQKLAGVPRPRNQTKKEVLRGKYLFFKIGCESCHRTNMVTASTEDPELDGQTISPFTDLLLHDMGLGLADNLPEFSATGREWRTTPLWGLGFLRTVSKTRQLYLHDGRARSIEEAIIWHSGESQKSRDRFMRMTKKDRLALVEFLKSL